MTNEIKEILDNLAKKSSIYKMQINRGTSFNTDEYEASLLLDYITNLQEENEYLKLSNPEMNIEHFRVINENKRKIDNLRKQNKELQEENERLNTNLDELQNAIDNIAEIVGVPEGMCVEDVYDKIKDYKSRNEKALDKLYCYGEVFDGKVLQQFQKEKIINYI